MDYIIFLHKNQYREGSFFYLKTDGFGISGWNVREKPNKKARRRLAFYIHFPDPISVSILRTQATCFFTDSGDVPPRLFRRVTHVLRSTAL